MALPLSTPMAVSTGTKTAKSLPRESLIADELNMNVLIDIEKTA
jgi:hypothetical protein